MNKGKRTGFTLVELLVVISILAVLVTMAITGLPYIAKMSRTKSTQTLLYTIELAALTYYEQYNVYPPESLDGKFRTDRLLKALSYSDTKNNVAAIHKFMDAQIKNDVLVDGWGKELYYMKPGPDNKIPKIWSCGPNLKNELGVNDPATGKDDICNLQGPKTAATPTPTPKP